MDRNEFSSARHFLGKSQSQLAKLLNISSRAVQSFEQGWRNIPPGVERHLLFLLSLKVNSNTDRRPCWEIRQCPDEWRANCQAWEFKSGHLCWFINGTFCDGKSRDNWKKKMELCRKCEVFRELKLPIEG